MVDFYIRENPIPNPSLKKSKGSEDPPVMLDYGQFGFPDDPVVNDWTWWGIIVVCFSVIIALVSVSLLGITIWSGYQDSLKREEMEKALLTQDNEKKTTLGFEPKEQEVFAVECMYNMPVAMAMSPDGVYLATGGGVWGYTAPARSSGFSGDVATSLELSPPSDPALALDFQMALGVARSEGTESAPSTLPGIDTEKIDTEKESGKETGEESEKKTAQTQLKRSPRRFTYDLDRGTGVIYADNLQLGPNGTRTSTEEVIPRKVREVEIDPAEALATGGSDLGLLPNLDDLPDDILDFETEKQRRARIWGTTRPGVETYPLAFWDLRKMEPSAVLWVHEFPISAVAFSPDATMALSADIAGHVILWKLQDVEPNAESGARHRVWKMIAVMNPNAREKQKMGRIISIHDAVFTPAGDQFILAGTALGMDENGNSYGEIGALILWDIDSWSEILRSDVASSRVDTWFRTLNPVGKYTDIQFTPNGKYLIAGAAGINSGVYWFDTSNTDRGICMAKNEQRRREQRYADPSSHIKPNLLVGVSCHEYPDADAVYVAISPDGKYVVSADNLGRTAFWNFAPNTTAADRGVSYRTTISSTSESMQTRHVRSVQFSKDGAYVIISGEELLVFNGRGRFEFLGDFQTMTNIAARGVYSIVSWWFTEDEKYLIAGCDDMKIRMWRMTDLPIVPRYGGKEGERPMKTVEETVKSAATVMPIQDSGANTREAQRLRKRFSGEVPEPFDENRALDSHNPIEKRMRGSEK
ncbi:MAG: WD40 repeat domain-containing protein [Planctomycetia bacterium]|nr:WD40 repeat domain-containing protein [Planctomycetia bacterium]